MTGNQAATDPAQGNEQGTRTLISQAAQKERT